jgi:hypothetical protein
MMKTPATILVATLAGGVPAVGCRPDRVELNTQVTTMNNTTAKQGQSNVGKGHSK